MIVDVLDNFEGLNDTTLRHLDHPPFVGENLPSNLLDNHLPRMDLNPPG